MPDPAGWNPDQPEFDPNAWAATHGIDISLRSGGLVPVDKRGNPLSDRPAGRAAMPVVTEANALGGGGRLSPAQIASIARGVGFPEATIPTITGIVMAESGGNPYAHNDNPKTRDDSYGITQINALAHGPVAKTALGDPVQAMKLALSISKGGTDFTPWTTYTSGAYKTGLHLPSGALGQSTAPNTTALADNLKQPANPLTPPQPETPPPSATPEMPKPNPLAMMALMAAGTHTFIPVKYDPFAGVVAPQETPVIHAAPVIPELAEDTPRAGMRAMFNDVMGRPLKAVGTLANASPEVQNTFAGISG